MYVFCIFCICTCSAQLSMFHMERRSRNTLIRMQFVAHTQSARVWQALPTSVYALWQKERLAARETADLHGVITSHLSSP